MHDRLTRAEETLQRDDQLLREKGKGRHAALDGIILWYCNDNPSLNALACDVEFPDR